jgi:hypothetical protein
VTARRLFPAILAVLVAVAPSHGNPVIAPPQGDAPAPNGPPRLLDPDNAVPFVVEVSDDAKSPRLLVPRGLLSRVKKVAVRDDAGAPRFAGRLMPLSAGLALAFAGAGLLLVRSGAGLRRLAVLVAVGGALALAGLAVAVQPVAVPMPPPPIALEGATVEVVEEGDMQRLDQGPTVRLVLPRATAADLAKMPPPPINWVAPPGHRGLPPLRR